MNFRKTAALASVATLMASGAFAASITQNSDANALASTILGTGVTITSATLIGADSASGTFNAGAGTIGIDEGIILSSGNVVDGAGPNASDSTGVDLGTAGFADLNALIPQTTQDGVRLDIEFTTDSGDVFFEYAFASEEYNEFTNSTFNDVFALFLDGVNIALVPGTSDPVSINTVNGGNPLGSGASNAGFFNNNDPSDGGPFFNIEYDGFTDVFTAEGIGLSAGTHTLSFAIADAGDGVLDSAIFIAGGSLSSEPPDPMPTVPLPASAWLMMAGLGAIGVVRRRKRS